VFLGFMVAMTPTLGLQIVLYLGLATLLRVNKVAGVPILFISNPLTAVPLYGFCCWFGHLLLHGGQGESSWQVVQARLLAAAESSESVSQQMLSADFWSRVGNSMAALGAELWVGSLVLGVLIGLPAYGLVLWGVDRYRCHTRAPVNPEPALAEGSVPNARSTPPPPP